uniref:Uncharacterized protein n=1 Tax=Streptomyces ambofaciens (strain ATCC 23877 / 3486 / DSM 40053 / JCM 4204 / NBRC 12836 / NRRL B-2516) TaxID=278992 RepID=A3KKI2_STRA7|nr:hypothetical protein SAML1232 [Streptomyces ambofaciens ATCC 23877]
MRCRRRPARCGRRAAPWPGARCGWRPASGTPSAVAHRRPRCAVARFLPRRAAVRATPGPRDPRG